jgi:hypothetical protein
MRFVMGSRLTSELRNCSRPSLVRARVTSFELRPAFVLFPIWNTP